jgi:hypothetical protein
MNVSSLSPYKTQCENATNGESEGFNLVSRPPLVVTTFMNRMESKRERGSPSGSPTSSPEKKKPKFSESGILTAGIAETKAKNVVHAVRQNFWVSSDENSIEAEQACREFFRASLSQEQKLSPVKRAPVARRAPPQTPGKVRINQAPQAQIYRQVQTAGKLLINGKNEIVIPFAKGTYMEAFTIDSRKDQLVKLYFRDFNEAKYKACMANSLENYRSVCDLDLPVSTIYNSETALQDHFFLVEFVPNPLDYQNEEQLKQVIAYFQATYAAGIACDLSIDNLRVDDLGVVKLIDFMEEKLSLQKKKDKFGRSAIQNLKSWCRAVRDANMKESNDAQRQKAQALIDELTNGLEAYGFDPVWKTEAMVGFDSSWK